MTNQEIANKMDWEGGATAFVQWAGREGIKEHVEDHVLQEAFLQLYDADERINALLPEPSDEDEAQEDEE